MKEHHLQAFADQAEHMAATASACIKQAATRLIETEIKGDGSPVTDVDKAVETRIRDIIAETFPSHGILGEEFDPIAPDAEFVWIIDPIDGTLPFLAGIPVFGTLIALTKGGVPIIGVIDMPMTGERWVGKQGQRTLRNGQPIQTRSCGDLSNALLSTSNQDYYDGATLKALEAMKAATRLAVYGGSCMAYAQLATGRIHVSMDVQFDIFDYLALVPVIEGAGGVITDWDGQPLTIISGDRFVAACDQGVHRQARRVIDLA